MDRCVSYQSNFFEYLMPSPVIFNTMCLSYDRTELFIMSFIRLIIWMVIYYVVSEAIDLDDYPVVKYTMLTILAINVLYIGIVVSLDPVFSVGAANANSESMESYKERTGSSNTSIPYELN